MDGFADVHRHQARRQLPQPLLETRDPLRIKAQCQGVRRDDIQRFTGHGDTAQMAQTLVELLHQITRGDQKQLPFRREIDGGGGAIHQGYPHRLLQRADATTEGRLGDMSLAGRSRKTARIGQGNEVFQPFGLEVHRGSR